LEAAEYQKYIHNVYNAIKISSFNWFRILGEKIGLKPEEINDIIHLTVRSAEGLWNPEYGTKDLGPYDGACLPKDTKMLRIFAETAGVDNSLLVAVEKVNKDTPCRQQPSNG
jgi:UDPglucose 6-dehydrogenase